MPLTSAERSKRYRKAHPDYSKKQNERIMQNPELLQKKRARRLVWYYVKTGRLTKQPCGRKNCNEVKAEAHHPRYDFPLYVLWRCRKHHSQIHK